MYKVLLVNDCKFENFIMRDMLTNLGHEVIISSEFDAVGDARELNCNVIIANLIMKEKTGDKLLEEIKILYPKIKCILSSSNDIRLEDFNKEIIDAIIHTPVTKEKLMKVLEERTIMTTKKDTGLISEKLTLLFCPYCGEKLGIVKHEIKFCPYCGEDLQILKMSI